MPATHTSKTGGEHLSTMTNARRPKKAKQDDFWSVFVPENAVHILFQRKSTNDGKPPTIDGWRCWSHPTPSLPVDDYVSKLYKAKKLRERAVLQGEWLEPFCPYYVARIAILIAITWASVAQRSTMEGLRTEKPQLEQLATDASKIQELIEHFSRRWYSNDLNGAAIFNPHHKLHDFLNQQLDHFEKIDAARETFASIVEAAVIEKSIVAPGGSPTGVWHREFIMRMGFAFRFLTGRDPSNTKSFRDLIEATYLCFDSNAVIPETSMRTMFSKLEKEPNWSWRIRIAAEHDWPPRKPVSVDEEEANYENLLKIAHQSAKDVLKEIRYLRSFCEVLVMGGPRLERDLRAVLPAVRQLPGWDRQYQAALAWKARDYRR